MFTDTIRVERTEAATILAVPRHLDQFTREPRPGLLGRIAGLLGLA